MHHRVQTRLVGNQEGETGLKPAELCLRGGAGGSRPAGDRPHESPGTQPGVLTPAPQLPFCGDEEAVGSARPRNHRPHPDPRQAPVSVGPPQILTQIAVGSCKEKNANLTPAVTSR